MGRIGSWRARWVGLSRPRRAGAVVVLALAAGLVGAALAGGPGQGAPAPVVWRDHVVDPTSTSGTR